MNLKFNFLSFVKTTLSDLELWIEKQKLTFQEYLSKCILIKSTYRPNKDSKHTFEYPNWRLILVNSMCYMTMNHSLWSKIHSKYLKSVFTKLKIFLNGPLIPRYDPFKTLYDVRFLIFLIPWSIPDCVFPDFGLEVLFYPFYQVYKCMDIFNLGRVAQFRCILNIFLNYSREQIR